MRFAAIVTVLFSLFMAFGMNAEARHYYKHRYYRCHRAYAHERPQPCKHHAHKPVVYTNHHHSYYAGGYYRENVRPHRFGHGYHNGYKHCNGYNHYYGYSRGHRKYYY